MVDVRLALILLEQLNYQPVHVAKIISAETSLTSADDGKKIHGATLMATLCLFSIRLDPSVVL
jgi:hypothetical protein